MAQYVVCSSCAKRLKVPDKFAGQHVKCPACQAPVKIPSPATSPTTVPRVATGMSSASHSNVTQVVQCPSCRRIVKLSAEMMGANLTCPACKTQLQLSHSQQLATSERMAGIHAKHPLESSAVPQSQSVETLHERAVSHLPTGCIAVYSKFKNRLMVGIACAIAFVVLADISSESLYASDTTQRFLVVLQVLATVYLKALILASAWDTGKYRSKCGNNLFLAYWFGSSAVLLIWSFGFVLAEAWSLLPTALATLFVPLLYYLIIGLSAEWFGR